MTLSASWRRLPARLRAWLAARPARPRLRRAVRWVLRGLLALLVLLVLARLLLGVLILPLVLDRIAARWDLACELDGVSIRLLAGEVEATGLHVMPREGGPDYLTVEHVRADLLTRDLLRGVVHIRRGDVDGLVLRVERGGAGSIPLFERLKSAQARKTKEEAREEDDGQPLPDLSPLRIDAVRLDGARLAWTDRAGGGEQSLDLLVAMRTDGLRGGSRERARWRIDLELLESATDPTTSIGRARLTGDLVLAQEEIGGEVELDLLSVRAERIAGYLRRLGLAPRAEELAGGLCGRISVRPAGAGDAVSLVAEVERVSLRADGVETLGLEAARFEAARLGPGEVHLGELSASRPRLRLVREPDGALALGGVAFLATTRASPDEPDDDDDEGPTTLALDGLRLQGGALRFVDQGVAPPASFALELEELALGPLRLDPRAVAAPSPSPVRLIAAAPGLVGEVALVGTASAAGGRQRLDLSLRLDGIRPQGAEPWLLAAGIEPTLRDGSLAAQLSAWIEPGAEGGVRGEARLTGLALREGRRELAALDEVAVLGVELGPGRAVAREVRVRGVRARGGSQADGTLRLPGLALLPERPSGDARPEPVPEPPAPRRSGAAPRLRLDRLELEEVRLRWTDAARRRTHELSAGLALTGLRLGDPEGVSAAARLGAYLRAPGLVEWAALEGAILPGPDEPALALQLSANGIDLRPFAPLLARAGLEPALEAGELEADLRAALAREADGIRASARIESLRLAERGRELVVVRGTGLEGLRVVAGRPGRIDLGRVRVEAIDLDVQLLPGDRLELAGVRTGAAGRGGPSRDRPAAVSSSAPPPPLSLRGVEVEAVRLALTDTRGEEPRRLEGELTARAGPLSFDPAGRSPAQATPWRVELRAPGMVERAQLAGEAAVGGGGGRLEARLLGEGISVAAIASYLPGSIAIEAGARRPVRLQGRVSAELRRSGEVLTGRAELADVAATTSRGELLGLSSLRVDGFRLDPRRLEVGAVEVRRPRALIRRDSRGRVSVAGIRPGAGPPRPEPFRVDDLPALLHDPRLVSRRPEHEPTPARAMRLGSLQVRGARIEWHDRAGARPIDLVLRSSLELGEVRTDVGAPPAPVQLRVRARGAIQRLVLDGSIGLDPARSRLDLKLLGEGLTLGRLGAYFPDVVTSEVSGGRIQAALRAELVPHADGGVAGMARLSGVALSQGERPLLSFSELAAVASRIDPAERRWELSRVRLTGLETTVAVDREGRVGVIGLSLGSPPPTNGGPEAAAVDTAALALDAEPVETAGLGPRPRSWPLVSVEQLELEAPRIQVWRPGAVPLDVALEVVNREPLVAGGSEAEVQPPCRLSLSGSVAPVVSAYAIQVDLTLRPSAPAIAVTWAVAGIQGKGLAAAIPELAAGDVDAAEIADGRFRGRAWFEGRPLRRGDGFDPAEGLAGFLRIDDVSLRDGPDGPLQAGLEAFEADLVRVVPGGPAHLRSVVVHRPAGVVVRTPTDVRLLGIKIARRQPVPPESTLPPGVQPPLPPPAPPRPALRIDSLAISGADLLYRDETFPSPLVIPISGLEVELRDLVQWGPLDMKRPPVEFDILAEMTGGKEGMLAYSAPAVCDEIHLAGSVSLGTPAVGVVGIDVIGLRLDRLAGPARSKDLVIGEGVLDIEDGHLRLRPDGSRRLTGDLHLTDFRVSDTSEGSSLSRLFRVPKGWTLNQLTTYARDEAGTIEVPLDLEISPRGQVEDMVELVLGIVGEVLVVDVTRNLPLRVGMPFWKATRRLLEATIPGEQFEDVAVDAMVRLDFEAGVAVLPPGERAKLAPLVDALERGEDLVVSLRHDLGKGDVTLMRRVTDPDPVHVREALARIELRRRALLLLRAEALAGGLEALKSSGSRVRPAAELMRTLDLELGAVLASRDELLALLRDGGDRQAGMRLRRGGTELARARLEAVRDAIVEGRPHLLRKIRLSRPRHGEPAGAGGGFVTVVPRKQPS